MEQNKKIKVEGLEKGDRISGNDGYSWKVGPKLKEGEERSATVTDKDGNIRSLINPELEIESEF